MSRRNGRSGGGSHSSSSSGMYGDEWQVRPSAAHSHQRRSHHWHEQDEEEDEDDLDVEILNQPASQSLASQQKTQAKKQRRKERREERREEKEEHEARVRVSHAASVAWVSGVESASASSSKPASKFAQRAADFRAQRAAELANGFASSNTSVERLVVPFTPLSWYAPSMFLAEPDDDLTCPICMHVVFDPPNLECCGHSFCRTCLVKWGAKTCPACRQSFASSKMLPLNIAAIASLVVRCPLPVCSWTGPLGMQNREYLAHIASCDHVELRCPDCSVTTTRRNFPHHRANLCHKREIVCEYCQARVRANRMPAHQSGVSSSEVAAPCDGTRLCPYGCVSERNGITDVTFCTVNDLEEHARTCPMRLTDCIVCPQPHHLPYHQLALHMRTVLDTEFDVAPLLANADELTALRYPNIEDRAVRPLTKPYRSRHNKHAHATSLSSSSSVAPTSAAPVSLPIDELEPDESAFALLSVAPSPSVTPAPPSFISAPASPIAAAAVEAEAAPSAVAVAVAAEPPSEVRLLFKLPGLNVPSTPIAFPREAALTHIMRLPPFSSLRTHPRKYYLILDDSEDWDEIFSGSTPAELGLEDGAQIGMRM